MSKYEDTRIVTFKEDYGIDKLDKDGNVVMLNGKPDKVIYYKKSTGPNDKHAIHFKVVDKLKEKGAKIEVELFDRKGYLKREKEKLLSREKPSMSVERR